MNAQDEVLSKWPRATVLIGVRKGLTVYRVAPTASAQRGYLSNWCLSPIRAWEAAARRLAHKANNKESW